MILDYNEYVTEQGEKGIVNFFNVNTNSYVFNHNSVRPFCGKKIENRVYHKQSSSTPDWLFGTFNQSETVIQCPVCGWWEYSYTNNSDAILDGIRASDVEYRSAILKSYDDSAIDVPVNMLRDYIFKHPDSIYNIDAHKMEELVRSVFSDFYPSCRVIDFGKTRDGGRDGLLIDENGKQFLISTSTTAATSH